MRKCMALLKPFRGFGVKITGGAWNPDLTPTWLSKSPCEKKKKPARLSKTSSGSSLVLSFNKNKTNKTEC
jgi:hypothetical protein